MKTKRLVFIGLAVIVLLLIALLIVILAIGPNALVIKPGHKRLPDAPAPTTVPLATVRPEPTVELQATAVPPTTIAAVTDAPFATITSITPTRVVPPADRISLPPGFGISVFAAGLRGPRMMALGPDGQLYLTERGAGRIVRLPDRDGDGVADAVEPVAEGLNVPSSIAFYKDGSLYVSETTRVLRLRAPDGDGVFQEQEVIVDGLPEGGHSTRTLLFSPDWETLYVSVGSSCNVCEEGDERRATILRYDPDGSGQQVYARGLRNAVGITFRPGTDELWATNNGRDWLGDDLPPETVYVVHQGDDAGWPRCHSGRIVDPDFGSPGACEGVLSPAVEIQAHTAPLGLAFYTGEQFPKEYRGDLFIALHGSWNRSVPVGYQVVRVPIDGAGQPGAAQDFASGWLREDGSNWGRPVDVLTAPDGDLFVSDDGAGNIYRIFYAGE